MNPKPSNGALRAALVGVAVAAAGVLLWFFAKPAGGGPDVGLTAPHALKAQESAGSASKDTTAATIEASVATGKVAAAQPAKAAGSAAEAPRPALKAVRQIPRKKLPLVELDLDGDGKPEQLTLTQNQPTKDWQGKDQKKGPNFVLEVRAQAVAGKPGKLLGRLARYGWGQGWAQIGVRIGGGSHVAIAYWAVPEAHEPRASYAWIADGKVHWGEFKRLPLTLIDLRFSQQEVVHTLSQELYHAYLKSGTTDLLQWQGGGFTSLLQEPLFELCVVAVQEPHVYLGVVPTDKHSLRLLVASESPDMPMNELWQQTVTPPSEGGPYTVPSGFALSCDQDAQQLQYKRQRFQFRDRTLKPLPDAPALGAAVDK